MLQQSEQVVAAGVGIGLVIGNRPGWTGRGAAAKTLTEMGIDLDATIDGLEGIGRADIETAAATRHAAGGKGAGLGVEAKIARLVENTGQRTELGESFDQANIIGQMQIAHRRTLQREERCAAQIGNQIEARFAWLFTNSSRLLWKAERRQINPLSLPIEANELELPQIPCQARLAQGQGREGCGGIENGFEICRLGIVDRFGHQQGGLHPGGQHAGGAANAIFRADQQQAPLTLVRDSGRDQVIGLDRMLQGIGASARVMLGRPRPVGQIWQCLFSAHIRSCARHLMGWALVGKPREQEASQLPRKKSD